MTLSLRIAIFSVVVILAFLIGRFIAEGKILFIGGIITVFLFLIVFSNLEYGLVLLTFAMLLSPELPLGAVPGREIMLRLDDLIIIAMFIAYLVWKTYYRHEPLFVVSPLLLPIALYTSFAIFSTARGIVLGYVLPIKALFYVLKYIEYFLIYFLVLNIVKTRETIKKILVAGLITYLVVCLHGYYLKFVRGIERLYAPFDAPIGLPTVGEAASLGGYLIITMSLILSAFCYSTTLRNSAFLLGAFVFALPVFAYTYSRASYYGFVPMILLIVLLTTRKKLLLLMMILLSIIFTPLLFPGPVKDVKGRLQETFAGPEEAPAEVVFGFKVKEMSALARVGRWRWILTDVLPKEPLFGRGVTGVGLVDTQIPLVIGETGLIGFTFFVLILYQLLKLSLKIFLTTDDITFRWLSLGFFAAIIGLIFQSVAVNTFIIIRIMSPFWLIAGLLSTALLLETKREEIPQPAPVAVKT